MFYGFCLASFGVLFCRWFSAANTHLRLLDRVVSGASFLTGGVFECDLAHHCSVAVLCILYKIRCNPMHPLCGALPVPVPVTHGAVIAHRFILGLLAAEPHSMAGVLFPCQYLCGTILVTPCGTGGFQEQGKCLFIGLAVHSLFVPCCFPFLIFHSVGLESSD